MPSVWDIDYGRNAAAYNAQGAAERERMRDALVARMNADNAAAEANYNQLKRIDELNKANRVAVQMFGAPSIANTDGGESDIAGISVPYNSAPGIEEMTALGLLGSVSPAPSSTSSTNAAPAPSYNGNDSDDNDDGGGGYYPEPQEPETATQLIDRAMSDGVNKEKAKVEQAKQQAAQAQKVQTANALLGAITNPMNTVQRQAAGKLSNYKQAWATLNDGYNTALAEGDEEKANQILAQRDKVAAEAGNYRNTLARAGIQLGDAFGANATLDQAKQEYAADALAGLNQILGAGNLSSDDVYMRDYKRYKDMGYSDRKAKKWAAQNAGEYRLQRISQLNNAFGNYGTNPDGSINDIGTNIVGMMNREDGEQAYTMNALRPGLREQYVAEQQRLANEQRFQNDLQKLAIQFQYQNALQDARLAARGVGGGRAGGGSGGDGEGGSSGGGRGRKSSTDGNIVKAAKEYIKHMKDVHKDDGDDEWKQDGKYQQALKVVDDNAADTLFPDYDIDNDREFVSLITAMREGRNPDGRYYSPQALDAFIDANVDDSTEDGKAYKEYLKQYNHSIGG